MTAATLEGAAFPAFWLIYDRGCRHPHLAVGATRTVDWQQFGVGFHRSRHANKIMLGQKNRLSAVRQKVQNLGFPLTGLRVVAAQ